MPSISPHFSFFSEHAEPSRGLAGPPRPRPPQIEPLNALFTELTLLALPPAALSQEAEPNNIQAAQLPPPTLSSYSIFALPTAAGSQEAQENQRLGRQHVIRTLFSSAQSESLLEPLPELLPEELPEGDKYEGNDNPIEMGYQ